MSNKSHLHRAQKITDNIVQNLKTIRELNTEISQKELAEEIGIHPSNMLRIENGERNLTMERFLAICFIMKTNPIELLEVAIEKAL